MKIELMEGISVVIPTYNSAGLLQKTLLSLAEQTLARPLFEVIVADDGSSDNSKEVVDKFKTLLNITYVYQPDQGFRVAAARNLGLAQARYNRTLFFDSGMVAAPDMLKINYQLALKNPQTAYIGMSYGVEEYSAEHACQLSELFDITAIEESFAELAKHQQLYDCRYPFMKSINFELTAMKAPWSVFWTGHVCIDTRLLLSIGGFDEWFSSWGGEDTELGIRIEQAGHSLQLLPGLLSLHYPHERDAEIRVNSSLENVRYIYNKHPNQYTQLMLKHNWLAIEETMFDGEQTVSSLEYDLEAS